MSAISLILKGRGDFFFDNFLHFCTIFLAAICALLVFLGGEGPEGMLFKSLILVKHQVNKNRNVVESIIIIFFLASSASCRSLLARADFFMVKLNLLIRSEIASKLKLHAPLKAAYEKFLFSSVIAFFDSFTQVPKNIPRTPKNCMETKL